METLENKEAKVGDTVYCIRDGHACGRPGDTYKVGQSAVISHWYSISSKDMGLKQLSENVINKCDWSLIPPDRIINNYSIF